MPDTAAERRLAASLAHGTQPLPPAISGLMAGLSHGPASAPVAIRRPFFGRLFDQQRYDLAFAVAACAPLLGLVLWRILNQIPSGRAHVVDGIPPGFNHL